MRRFLSICILSLALAITSSAQDIPAVICPDGTSVDPLLTVILPAQPPATRDDLPEPYFVSAITNETKPTLAAADETGLIACAPQDTLAETVYATFGLNLEVPQMLGPTPYSSWVSTDAETAKTASIGELQGTSLIVIEGGKITRNDGEGDIYTLIFDSTLIDRFEVFVLGTDETYQPDLTLLNSDNAPLVEDSSQPPFTLCSIEACTFDDVTQISYSGLRVPGYESKPTDLRAEILSESANSLTLRVEANKTEGAYTLLIRFSLPEPEVKKISAQAVDNGDGTWTVQCDGQVAFENGAQMEIFPLPGFADLIQVAMERDPSLDLPMITPEKPLTLTALSPDTPVILAVMTSDTEGYCIRQTPETAAYNVILPDLEVPATINGAQVTLTETPKSIIIGSAQPTQITLILEGWDTPLLPTDDLKLPRNLHSAFLLNVLQSTLESGIRVYVIAADDNADPVALIKDSSDNGVLDDINDQILWCDNAGVPDECYASATSLNGYSITLADGRVLPGARVDAMINFNSVDAMILRPNIGRFPILVAAADNTGQGGPLVIVVAFSLNASEQLLPK